MNKILKKKVNIIGHKRHGKDTLAEILRDNFNFSFKSSSEAAAEIFIYDLLKDKYGYNSFEECFEDRVNHRKEWYDLITGYNSPDKMRLAQKILESSDCYVGMRNYYELEAAKDLFDLIIWVDASERLPFEGNDSMTAVKEQADIIVSNNGTLEEFTKKVLRLGGSFYDSRG